MASKRPKVLIITEWFSPAYRAGGPITSIENLVSALESEVDFGVICSNSDHAVETLLDVPVDQWTDRRQHRVFYGSSKKVLRKRIKEEIKKGSWDKVYLNSLFSPLFTLYPLLRAKGEVILAPRGMLGAGALSIKSRKKRLFLFTTKSIRLFDKVYWHATDESEKEEIQKHFGMKSRSVVIPNLPSPVSKDFPQGRRSRDHWVFFSRVSPIKNLEAAMRILAKLPESPSLTVLGPREDEAYAMRCEALASQLNLRVEWSGAVDPRRIPELLPNFGLMILPTLHENYGHVIVQSWGSGVPVMISENTPWRALRGKNLGWDLPLDYEAAWIAAGEEFMQSSEDSLKEMSKNCHSFALHLFNQNSDRTAYLELFNGN
jgi:glycosyltransferase involved in cell wall biosynthesis